jgi:hypothetical protein
MRLVIFQNYDEAFSQYRHGLLDEHDFNGVRSHLRWTVQQPDARVAWKRLREAFTREFAEFIDKTIAEVPLGQSILYDAKFVTEWKADIAAELAKAAA